MWPKTMRAERPHAEAGAEGGEAREQLRRLVALREEQPAEEDRQAAVQIEVVPLEERSERRGEDDPPQALLAGRRFRGRDLRLGRHRRARGMTSFRPESSSEKLITFTSTRPASGPKFRMSSSRNSFRPFRHTAQIIPFGTIRSFASARNGRSADESRRTMTMSQGPGPGTGRDFRPRRLQFRDKLRILQASDGHAGAQLYPIFSVRLRVDTRAGFEADVRRAPESPRGSWNLSSVRGSQQGAGAAAAVVELGVAGGEHPRK